MTLFRNPDFINAFRYNYQHFENIPDAVFNGINRDLDALQSTAPVVSIIISAWNEEVNILASVASLSKLRTKYPLEIIVINNNSTDNTQQTIDRLHVRTFFESTQGCGPARQLGQEKARGKYILLADADCIYPACWVNEMMKVLQQPGISCVYGRYSFISEAGFARWKLFLLERMKDLIANFRHLNRPYFNCYGISMGYIREFGLKVGFIKTNFWGDDGQMCLGLMQFGKIKQVKSNKARAWTGPRTLQRDGDFFSALKKRLIKEAKRFMGNFSSVQPLAKKHTDQF